MLEIVRKASHMRSVELVDVLSILSPRFSTIKRLIYIDFHLQLYTVAVPKPVLKITKSGASLLDVGLNFFIHLNIN